MERILIKEAKEHINKKVTFSAWAQSIRKLGGIIFILLRDRSGTIQAVCENENLNSRLENIKPETVIELTGVLAAEPRASLGVELKLEDFKLINEVNADLPVQLNKKEIKANLDTILDHRSVCLRHLKSQVIFKIQAKIAQGFREFLIKNDFVEIFTPKIVSSGAEGGSDIFKVNYFDKIAYLTQSPQLYKQIMVGVFERVFEVAPAFRAEPHSTQRHLNEFVSLDLEMGFIEDFTDIMKLENELLKYIFELIQADCEKELELFKAALPKIVDKIPIMKLRQAQEIIEKTSSRKCVGEPDFSPEDERLICQYSTEKFDSEFIFVTHFPVDKKPFYTFDDPDDIGFTKSFDLLFRGSEITSGGQRIHKYEDYLKKMKLFKMNPVDFDFYLEAFKYGMPPHGGFAIGLERLTAKILNIANIREASLFPRDMNRIVP